MKFIRLMTYMLIVLPYLAKGQKTSDIQITPDGTVTDTLQRDSVTVREVAPLDIPQDRGLFIVTPDRQMQMRILGSVRMLVVYDNLQINNKNSLNTFDIPVGKRNKPLPNFYAGLIQTRLGFEVTRKTNGGTLFARLETDFAGSSGFRIRHAYGEYKNMLAGQTWSLFSQITASPATVDFAGPTGSVRLRTPQIRYSSPAKLAGMNFALAVEYILPDHSLPDSLAFRPLQFLPDLTFRLDKNFSKGYWQFSGILPVLSGQIGQDNLVIRTGWGLATSAHINTWPKGKWYLQAVTGRVISGLISDLRGQGLDIVLNSENKAVEPFLVGAFAGYEQQWNKKLSSNLIFALAQTEKLSFLPAENYRRGQTFRTNTFWSPTEGAKLGAEFIWARKHTMDGQHGDAVRLNVLFYYDF